MAITRNDDTCPTCHAPATYSRLYHGYVHLWTSMDCWPTEAVTARRDAEREHGNTFPAKMGGMSVLMRAWRPSTCD